MIDWLIAEAGNLRCLIGWHTWRAKAPILDGLERVVIESHCCWCKAAGRFRSATQAEADEYRKRQQYKAQVNEAVCLDLEAEAAAVGSVEDEEFYRQSMTIHQGPFHDGCDLAEELGCEVKTPRKPAGKSTLKAPSEQRLRQTEAMLRAGHSDQVTVDVLTAQCKREEPLVPRNFVVSRGPLKPTLTVRGTRRPQLEVADDE